MKSGKIKAVLKILMLLSALCLFAACDDLGVDSEGDIFQSSAVKQIYIGYTEEQVQEKLGEPNKRTEVAETAVVIYEYFGDTAQENPSMQAEQYAYIEIAFEDNEVSEVFLDTLHGAGNESEKTRLSFRLENAALQFGDTGCNVEYSVVYTGGSFYRAEAYAKLNDIGRATLNQKAELEWEDRWEHSYTGLAVVEGGEGVLYGEQCYIQGDTLAIMGNDFELSSEMADLGEFDYRQVKNIVMYEEVGKLDFKSDKTNFNNWIGLENVYYKGNATDWCKIQFGVNPLEYGHNLYIKDNLATEIIITPEIKVIPENAFANCATMESLIIENGIAEIETAAFSGCTNLRKITIPESITKIGEDVFAGCLPYKQQKYL